MLKYINTKQVVTVTAVILIISAVSVYIYGSKDERTIQEELIILISILSILLFAFLTIGLYKGIKLKDDFSNISLRPGSFFKLETADAFTTPHIDVSGIGEFIASILIWFIISIIISLLLWLLGNVLIFLFLLIAAVLYWIYFRALRLVFKKSEHSKGDMARSLTYGTLYTVLYTFWIYLLIYTYTYLNSNK